eukprot:316720-Hanusia_phi.AAC.1
MGARGEQGEGQQRRMEEGGRKVYMLKEIKVEKEEMQEQEPTGKLDGSLKGITMGDEVLELYSDTLHKIFSHYARGDNMDATCFMECMAACSITPEPLALDAVSRIFKSGARGSHALEFQDFLECLERCSLMGFLQHPETQEELSYDEAMVQLLRRIDKSKVYKLVDPSGKFLLPEHAAADESDTSESAEEDRKDQASDQGVPDELSAEETDRLLRALFHYYCMDGKQSSKQQMVAGKFYKFVRECKLMDSRVDQDAAGKIYKQVMKISSSGVNYIAYSDFVEALALLANLKYDNVGSPLEVFTRLVNDHLKHNLPEAVKNQMEMPPDALEEIKESQQKAEEADVNLRTSEPAAIRENHVKTGEIHVKTTGKPQPSSTAGGNVSDVLGFEVDLSGSDFTEESQDEEERNEVDLLCTSLSGRDSETNKAAEHQNPKPVSNELTPEQERESREDNQREDNRSEQTQEAAEHQPGDQDEEDSNQGVQQHAIQDEEEEKVEEVVEELENRPAASVESSPEDGDGGGGGRLQLDPVPRKVEDRSQESASNANKQSIWDDSEEEEEDGNSPGQHKAKGQKTDTNTQALHRFDLSSDDEGSPSNNKEHSIVRQRVADFEFHKTQHPTPSNGMQGGRAVQPLKHEETSAVDMSSEVHEDVKHLHSIGQLDSSKRQNDMRRSTDQISHGHGHGKSEDKQKKPLSKQQQYNEIMKSVDPQRSGRKAKKKRAESEEAHVRRSIETSHPQ